MLVFYLIKNIVPSAGCAVIAGDGGVDAVEADGIACAGGMAADNPLCTEQFKNADLAALKVAPEAGYEFAYWEMNEGIIQQASAEPLFLSTMQLFAGLVVVPTSRVATMKAHCLSVTLQSVAFAGMPAAVVKDDGSAYPTTHWQRSTDPSYAPSPVAFVSGSRMTATATFAVQPADFSGTLTIRGSGANGFDFPPTAASVKNGIASVTIPCKQKFPEKMIDIFDPMTITWTYQTASGRFQEAGTSKNPVYVTLGNPLTSPLYHTLVHLGCHNAKGKTTEAEAVAAIWEDFHQDRRILTVEPKKLLTYWLNDQQGATDTTGLLGTTHNGNGNCQAWSSFFIDVLKAQQIAASQIMVKSQAIGESLMVKEWTFVGEGLAPNKTPYAYIEGTDVTLKNAIDAQGNTNPPSKFNVHYIVKYNGQFYDPSYGAGPFNNPSQWEDASLDGFFIKFINDDETYVRKNIPNVEETRFQ